MPKRKPSEIEVEEVQAKGAKKSKSTMNIGMFLFSFTFYLRLLHAPGTLIGEGWLAAGGLMPDLVGVQAAAGSLPPPDPTKLSCHRNTTRRATRPQTLNPSSLLATNYRLTSFKLRYLFLCLDFFLPRFHTSKRNPLTYFTN